MSPEEQLNKFLRSVEKEQELRQMKEASTLRRLDEKSPRDRRRRRQLLKRMTDGVHAKHQNSITTSTPSKITGNETNEYAVIEKKKTNNSKKEFPNDSNEPVRWRSLNGINNTLVNGRKGEEFDEKSHRKITTEPHKTDQNDTEKENKHRN